MQVQLSEADRQQLEATRPLRESLAARIVAFVGGDREKAAPLPGVSLFYFDTPSPSTAYFYEPSFAVILGGRKRVSVGDRTYVYDPSRFLLTSINLPTIAEVFDIDERNPYVAMLIKLDLAIAREVLADIGVRQGDEPCSDPAMATGPASPELFSLVQRTLDLFEAPQDQAFLWKLIQHELSYRLLVGPLGARLRQIVRLGTRSNGVAKAVSWMKEHYASAIKVEELAALAGMGVSTFHHHFREITSLSPLQYQKQIRLHEARRLLVVESLDAATVALQVGYESPTQFNREYRRLFGQPPIRDTRLAAPAR